jgi:hypothetical protein
MCLRGTAGDEMLKASRERADTLADQLKSALDELSEILGREEKQLEELVAERPSRGPRLQLRDRRRRALRP